jgi:hypothetical protein
VERVEKLWAQGKEDDVVDVEQQVNSVDAAAVDEEQGVQLGLHKSQGDQVGDEAVVPRSRRLLHAVEGLVEPAYQLRVCKVNEVSGLRAVDGLKECDVEQDVLDVELVHGSTPGDSQSQHSSNGGRPNDKVEDLIVVHPGVLSEPMKDPTSLVPIKRVIRLEFVLEDPLAGGDIGPRRPRNQVPRAVRQQSLIFLLHSAIPMGVCEHATDRGRDRRQCRGSDDGREL